MAIKGWRVTDTYIRCVCDAIGMSPDCLTVFEYHPVVGEGYIKLPGTGSGEDWGDNVIPIEYDRFKTRVELLRDLGYSVMFIATKVGTTEDEVRKIVGKDYIHKDYSEMRSEYFILLNENARLRDEVRAKKDEIETLENMNKVLKTHPVFAIEIGQEEECKRLAEENAKLKEALESEKADSLQFEHRGKELTEKNEQLTKMLSDLQDAHHRLFISRDEQFKHIEALERKVEELTTENEEQRTIIRSLTEYKDSWREEALRYKAEIDELHERNKTLRTQRNMAIRLLFCTRDYSEIANALHIPESLIGEIVEGVIDDQN